MHCVSQYWMIAKTYFLVCQSFDISNVRWSGHGLAQNKH